jgi:hypothetical protein
MPGMGITHKITGDLRKQHHSGKQRRNQAGQFHGVNTPVPQPQQGFRAPGDDPMGNDAGPETAFGAEAMEADLEPGAAGLGDGCGDSLGDF